MELTRDQEQAILNSQFAKSRWWTRGWTLQELIAPYDLDFYDSKYRRIGSKAELFRVVNLITKIDEKVLLDHRLLPSISIAKRMSWAARRATTRVEDMAYSLLGLFQINMAMLYGEGWNAFIRLQEEIIKTTHDHSIFAWTVGDTYSTHILAPAPKYFDKSDRKSTAQIAIP